MRRGLSSRESAGFTLLEVIIAFALLALALTLLLGSLSGASAQIRHANHATRAALHAQSLMAQAGVGEILQPGTSEGAFSNSDYRWTLQVSPYEDPADPARSRPPAAQRLLQLDLEVAWGEAPRERLRWQTLRLVPVQFDQQGRLP